MKSIFKNPAKRKKFIIICLAVLLCTAVAATIAISTDLTAEIKNMFIVPEPDDKVEEEFPENTEKDSITVKNDGKYDEYLRVAVVYNWKNEDGDVLGKAVPSDYYEGAFDTDNWIKIGDYYYCKTVVKTGESSPELLDSPIKLTAKGKSNIPLGYHFSVDIITQNVQSNPAHVVSDVWGVAVDASGKITGGAK